VNPNRIYFAIALMLSSWFMAVGQQEKAAKDSPTIPSKSLKQWAQDLRSTDASVRDFALLAIPHYGSSTADAIIAVTERCLDTDAGCRTKAVMALAVMEIHDRDVPRVVEALARRAAEDPQASIRFLALNALMRFEAADGKKTVSSLIKAAEYSGSYEVRKTALAALIRFAGDPQAGPDPKAVRCAVLALKDNVQPVRYAAINAIALLGKPNEPVMATMVEKALNDLAVGNDKVFAIWAKVGLANLDTTQVASHLQFVIRMLKTGDSTVKAEAMKAIAAIGPLAKSAVPDVVDVLQDKDWNLVMMAIMTLSAMGTDGKAGIDALNKLAEKKEAPEQIKQAAKSVSGVIKGTNLLQQPGMKKQ